MLITLLGAGNGLRNGIIFNFRRFSANTVEVWGRYTTMPYKGNPTNRRIEFKEADLSGIKMAFPEIEYCSATISQTDTISYGEEYIVGDLRGVSEDYNSIIYINVASQNGRFINKMDMNATRKVIILSPRTVSYTHLPCKSLSFFIGNSSRFSYSIPPIYSAYLSR